MQQSGSGGGLGAFVRLYKQLILVLTLVKNVARCVLYAPFSFAAWPGQWLSRRMTDTLSAGLFRDIIASHLCLN